MKFKHVNMIGVELEGGWRDPDIQHHKNFHEDGSVELDELSEDKERNCQHEHDSDCYDIDCQHEHTPDCCDHCQHEHDENCERENCGHDCDDNPACWEGGASAGEMVSDPGSLPVVFEFMDKYWPDETNKSCGMHVHISLKSNLDYSRLMSVRFYRHFMRKMKIFGERRHIHPNSPFWERFEGKNRYCERNDKDGRPDFRDLMKDQPLGKNRDSRYRHVNFCYGKHGTVEIRMLPMFKKISVAKSAVTYMTGLIERYLRKKSKERVFTEVWETPATEAIEEQEELCVSL